MFAIICTLLGVGVAAIAVTWYAVVSAEEGYEDETGYHPLPRENKPASPPTETALESEDSKEESEARPCAPAR